MSRSERSADIRRIKSDGDIATGDLVGAGRDSRDIGAASDAVTRANSTSPHPGFLSPLVSSSTHPLSLPPTPIVPPTAHTASNTAPISSRTPSIVGAADGQQAREALELIQADLERLGRQHREHNLSLYTRTMAFFGYGREGSRKRRAYVSLLWNLASSLAQVRGLHICD